MFSYRIVWIGAHLVVFWWASVPKQPRYASSSDEKFSNEILFVSSHLRLQISYRLVGKDHVDACPRL